VYAIIATTKMIMNVEISEIISNIIYMKYLIGLNTDK